MAQTVTGGDPDAVSHPAQASATHPQSDQSQKTSPQPQSAPRQTTAKQSQSDSRQEDSPLQQASSSKGNNHSNGLVSKVEQACTDLHLPPWLTTALVTPLALLIALPAFIMRIISFAVSKVLYALNDILSSTEIPPWALRIMSGLAQGPMKGKLLQLYAQGGDHSRRLSSVVANGKFSSVTAGPDDLWEVSADHPFCCDCSLSQKTMQQSFCMGFDTCLN